MVRCADGVAVGYDVRRAAQTAATQATRSLGGPADLALVFVAAADPDEAEGALRLAGVETGARHVIGCLADEGVIGGRHGIRGPTSASVWLAQLPDAHARSFHLEVMRTRTSLAVVGLPERRGDDVAALVLADTWSFPVEGFVEQTATSLPGLPVVGGLAGGAQGAGATRLLVDGRVVDRGAVGVMLGGEVAVSAVVSQGCRPVGPPMTVTSAEGNVLLELAGRPALDRLEEVLLTLSDEDRVLAASGLQLGIAADEYADDHEIGEYVVRGLAGVDPDQRAVAVGDVVDVGRTVRFQLRDPRAAESELVTSLGGMLRRRELDRVAGALVFSCTSRGGAPFGRPDDDVTTVKRAIDGGPVAGFFATGEIGPVAGRNQVHGFAASVLAVGEPVPADAWNGRGATTGDGGRIAR